MSGLRVVAAQGDPHARGLTIGRELADLIHNSLAFYHRYLDRRGISSPQLQELLTPFIVATEDHTPDLLEVIKGMAEGATAPVLELFAINAFEELEALLEPVEGAPLFLQQKGGKVSRTGAPQRCTAFTLVGEGYTIVAHNEHWFASDIGNVAVVQERATPDGPWTISPTPVTCLGASGMNSHGIAMGIQSVTASDDRVGVPRVLVSRRTLGATDLVDAARLAATESRSGGYGYVVGQRGGATCRIETTATREEVIDGPGVHTNHYLDPDLAEMAPTPSNSSATRYANVTKAIEERHPSTPEDAMAILREVDFTPEPVPGEDTIDEAEGIVFSMVSELESGRMWVAPGPPKVTPYEEVEVPGAA